jgi:hypothetical protein
MTFDQIMTENFQNAQERMESLEQLKAKHKSIKAKLNKRMKASLSQELQEFGNSVDGA